MSTFKHISQRMSEIVIAGSGSLLDGKDYTNQSVAYQYVLKVRKEYPWLVFRIDRRRGSIHVECLQSLNNDLRKEKLIIDLTKALRLGEVNRADELYTTLTDLIRANINKKPVVLDDFDPDEEEYQKLLNSPVNPPVQDVGEDIDFL